jgi:predicted DNA-binding protein
MRPKNVKTAKLGGRHQRDFLVRLPLERYEGLVAIAKQQGTSLCYQVNEAIHTLLIRVEQETTRR